MVKEGYKLTEAGLIPEDWDTIPFEECFDILSNNTLARADLNYYSGIVRNIHYGDVLTKFDVLIDCSTDQLPFVNASCLSKCGTSLLKDGDIVIADTAEDETVGKAVELRNVVDSSIVSGLHTIPCRPKNPEKFVPKWLGYYLNYRSYHDQLLPFITGIKVSSITRAVLPDTVVAIPSKREQELIVNALMDIDKLIKQIQSELEKLKNLKIAYLSELLPHSGNNLPSIRMQGFESAWQTKRLGECLMERNERSAEGELISVTINDGIKKFSELGRYDKSSEDKTNYKYVVAGDIVYNTMRMWQGASGLSPYSGIVSPAYTVLTAKENMSSAFFSYAFKQPEMINKFLVYSQGMTSDTWNLKYPLLAEIEMFVPEYEEQLAIVERFEQLDSLIRNTESKLDKYRKMKSGMMDELLTGKTRLV